MSVITRFAPSPTGYLHIGSARTALFNWLFARHSGGKFMLRIEDTDRARSTQDAIDKIIQGMEWLGLSWDDDIVFQFSRAHRHQEVAHMLLQQGKAYYCYCTPTELEDMREKARSEGKPPIYDGRWRDRDPHDAPSGVMPTLRLKAPQTGETILEDLVQGKITVNNNQLDDMILLRSDGTPTYMLSVVVDDHDMGITHVIRGDDHLTNTFRQKQLYQACHWNEPLFSHIPLIHGADGAKLSKRHGALGVEAYAAMGILPEALCNYLLRLGWSHGDDEIIPRTQAIQWFNLESIGRSPARFDLTKLMSLNAHYLRECSTETLLHAVTPFIEDHIKRPLSQEEKGIILKGLPGLAQRSKTTLDLWENALIYVASYPLPLSKEAALLVTEDSKHLLKNLLPVLSNLADWSETGIEQALREFATQSSLKFGHMAQPLRIALTGKTISPSIFEVMSILEKGESLKRIEKFTL